jgi:predicted HAD superfamily Cof-like phosphohydrolase
MRNHLSPTAVSNLFTMGVSARLDPRQRVPASYEVPPVEVRRLRARLIMEEALETVRDLGFTVEGPMGTYKPPVINEVSDLRFCDDRKPSLEGIIDGCCDSIYVNTGTLLVCGAPDVPHLAAVNAANNAKFPGAVALCDAHGKFMKPEGWLPPDHGAAMTLWAGKADLTKITDELIKENSDACNGEGNACVYGANGRSRVVGRATAFAGPAAAPTIPVVKPMAVRVTSSPAARVPSRPPTISTVRNETIYTGSVCFNAPRQPGIGPVRGCGHPYGCPVHP